MATQPLCPRHGRPAGATRTRLRPDGTQGTEYLFELDLEEETEKGQRPDVMQSLSPDAKAALLAAYEESRELGASYVGPEHVLLALARDAESAAGQLLERFGVSHTKLRGAVIRGVEAGGGAREMRPTPTHVQNRLVVTLRRRA